MSGHRLFLSNGSKAATTTKTSPIENIFLDDPLCRELTDEKYSSELGFVEKNLTSEYFDIDYNRYKTKNGDSARLQYTTQKSDVKLAQPTKKGFELLVQYHKTYHHLDIEIIDSYDALFKRLRELRERKENIKKGFVVYIVRPGIYHVTAILYEQSQSKNGLTKILYQFDSAPSHFTDCTIAVSICDAKLEKEFQDTYIYMGKTDRQADSSGCANDAFFILKQGLSIQNLSSILMNIRRHHKLPKLFLCEPPPHFLLLSQKLKAFAHLEADYKKTHQMLKKYFDGHLTTVNLVAPNDVVIESKDVNFNLKQEGFRNILRMAIMFKQKNDKKSVVTTPNTLQAFDEEISAVSEKLNQAIRDDIFINFFANLENYMNENLSFRESIKINSIIYDWRKKPDKERVKIVNDIGLLADNYLNRYCGLIRLFCCGSKLKFLYLILYPAKIITLEGLSELTKITKAFSKINTQPNAQIKKTTLIDNTL